MAFYVCDVRIHTDAVGVRESKTASIIPIHFKVQLQYGAEYSGRATRHAIGLRPVVRPCMDEPWPSCTRTTMSHEILEHGRQIEGKTGKDAHAKLLGKKRSGMDLKSGAENVWGNLLQYAPNDSIYASLQRNSLQSYQTLCS